MGADEKGNLLSAAWFLLPSRVNGQPFISHSGEELQFRFIADQRVFETTFTVSLTDFFDDSEQVLRMPSSVYEPSTP